MAYFQCEDAIAEVVPVDNDLAPSEPANEPHQREGRDTGRVLTLTLSLASQLGSPSEAMGRTWTMMNSGGCGILTSSASRM